MCDLEAVYGFQKEIRGGIGFVKRSTIFYIAGQTGIFQSVPGNAQKFFSLPQTSAIAATALKTDGTLALAAKGSEPKFFLIDLKTGERTSLPNPDSFNSDDVVHLSFSKNEYLAAQGGSPSWPFVLWNVRTRAVSQTFLPFRPEIGARVFEFAFRPEDGSTVAAVGRFYLRTYRHQNGRRFHEDVFHEHERAGRTYHSVAWIRGAKAFAVGTSDGTVLVFRRGRLLSKITVCDKLGSIPRILQHIRNSDNRNIRCLRSTKDSLLCSYGGNTVLSLRRKGESFDFEIMSSISVPEAADEESSDIVQLAVNSEEDGLTATTEDGRILFFSFKKVEAVKDTGFETHFDVMLEKQLQGDLVDADTAGFKTVHVGCSTSEVILWQYDERKVLQTKKLDEGIKSVSIHPQGFSLLVGYDTGAKIYNILHDSLEEVGEFDTRATQVSFSTEGHIMAISNRKRIGMYSSLNLEKLGELKGHRDEVTHMMWMNFDSYLLTSDDSGTLIGWNVATQQIAWSFSDDMTPISKLTNAQENGSFYAATVDKRIQLFQYNQKAAEIKTPQVVKSLVAAVNMLLAGTENGSILGYTLDLREKLFEKRCHKGNILEMALFFHGKSLLVTGQDGAVSVWTLQSGFKSNIPLTDEDLFEETAYKARLTELENTEKELKEKLALSKDKTDQLREEQDKEVSEMKQKYENIKLQLQETILALNKDIFEKEIESERKRLQKTIEVVNDINGNRDDYKEKLEKEAERWEALKEEKLKIVEINEKKIKDLKGKIEKTEAILKEERELTDIRVAEMESKIQEEELKLKEIEERCKEQLKSQQVKMEEEAKEIKLQQESELRKAQQENQKKEREINRLQAAINYEKECGRSLYAVFETKKKMYDDLKEIIKKIKLRIRHVGKDVERKEKELKDKMEMVKVLEDDAKEYEHTTSEANLQILERKAVLSAKEEELSKLCNEKKQLENLQESLLKKVKGQQREQKLLDEKLQAVEKSMDNCTQKILGAQLLLESYRNEFIEATKNVEGANALRWAFLELVDKRASKSRIKEEEAFVGDTDPYIKFCRQRDHYESLLNTVLNRKQDIQSSFKSTYVKLAKENSDWVAFAETVRLGLQYKVERIRILEEAVKMPAEDFSKDPQETQRRFNAFYDKVKDIENQEQEEIRKRLDLIKEQEKEIQRLHGLLVVEEKGKVTRKGLH